MKLKCVIKEIKFENISHNLYFYQFYTKFIFLRSITTMFTSTSFNEKYIMRIRHPSVSIRLPAEHQPKNDMIKL